MAALIAESRSLPRRPPPGIRIEIDMSRAPRLNVNDAHRRGWSSYRTRCRRCRARPVEPPGPDRGRAPRHRGVITASGWTRSLRGSSNPIPRGCRHGLGMAIARKAIEEHGGQIEVTSAPGRGTTMRIMLPISPEASTTTFTAERTAGRRLD